MAAGRPGDDPVTDLLVWGMSYYGPELDGMFKEMAKLMSREELDAWWTSEIGWKTDPEVFRAAITWKLKWAKARANS